VHGLVPVYLNDRSKVLSAIIHLMYKSIAATIFRGVVAETSGCFVGRRVH